MVFTTSQIPFFLHSWKNRENVSDQIFTKGYYIQDWTDIHFSSQTDKGKRTLSLCLGMGDGFHLFLFFATNSKNNLQFFSRKSNWVKIVSLIS